MNAFAIRHGETAWSLSEQYTETTDMTDEGRRLVERMQLVIARSAFGPILCSPMQRARELPGFGDKAVIDSDLAEWNYGEYRDRPKTDPRGRARLADFPGWVVSDLGELVD